MVFALAGVSPNVEPADGYFQRRVLQLRWSDVGRRATQLFNVAAGDPSWCGNRIIELAAANMNNFIRIDATGKVEIDFKRAQACRALGQIKEITPKWLPGKDGTPPTLIEVKAKLFDPLPALCLLAHMFGMLKGGFDAGKPPEDV